MPHLNNGGITLTIFVLLVYYWYFRLKVRMKEPHGQISVHRNFCCESSSGMSNFLLFIFLMRLFHEDEL